MDVSQQLADYAAANAAEVLERPTPVELDTGLLAAYDTTPVDADEYKAALEPHLLALTLTSTQALLAGLFSLPTKSSEHGPVAQLADPTFVLPREKPLPKPKPLTKWERFANAKGISHVKKDKKVWDDERQEWVARWGRDGKNKDAEDQWLHEVKNNGSDPTIDPRATAKAERKARTEKNAKQHARNLAEAAASPLSTLDRKPTAGTASQGEKANARSIRKAELDRGMLVSKVSTASLGRFDKSIEGEPRVKGIKRKFETNLGDHASEKASAMDVLNRLGTAERKRAPKKGGSGVEGGVNTRKAVRYEERAAQLANRRDGKSGGGRGGRGGKSGRGGRK